MDKKQTFVTAAARASNCKVYRSSQSLLSGLAAY
jgi:hypothetical protein